MRYYDDDMGMTRRRHVRLKRDSGGFFFPLFFLGRVTRSEKGGRGLESIGGLRVVWGGEGEGDGNRL